MKKILSSLLLTIISFSVMAQLSKQPLNKNLTNGIDTVYTDFKSGLGTIYGDGKQLAKYGATKADSLLNKAGRVVGNASEIVWETLVAQQRVKSIAILFAILAYFGLIFIYKKQLTKFTLFKDKHDDYTFHQHVFIWLGLGILIGLGIFNISHFTTMLTGFINPKYSAMVDLLEMANYIIKK